AKNCADEPSCFEICNLSAPSAFSAVNVQSSPPDAKMPVAAPKAAELSALNEDGSMPMLSVSAVVEGAASSSLVCAHPARANIPRASGAIRATRVMMTFLRLGVRSHYRSIAHGQSAVRIRSGDAPSLIPAQPRRSESGTERSASYAV